MCRTLDAGSIVDRGGPNPRFRNWENREGEIGESAANEKKNATSHVARGRKAASFFFLIKRGLVCAVQR